MSDIVIYCPCQIHTDTLRRHDKNNRYDYIPKILLIVSETTIGEIIVQCGDFKCRKHSGPNYNGYYKIDLNGLGNYTIELLPKQWFEPKKVPFVEIGDD